MAASTRRLNVLIADDHPVVRAGLRLLLEREEGITPVAEAATSQAAVECAARARP
jgi:DNA-binding NarL/FixJ family response regulator